MGKVLRFMEPQLKPYWPKRKELLMQNGCIVWANRVVIPLSCRNSVLGELHGGHPGMSHMKAIARGLVWWPGIDEDIEAKVKACSACQQAQKQPTVSPLHPWQWPTRPWSRLQDPWRGKCFCWLLMRTPSGWKWHLCLPDLESLGP